MPKPFIITIDGPAGVGKTTLAKQTAHFFSIAYLDTGAMFRAMGITLSRYINPERHSLDLDEQTLEKILNTCSFTLSGTGKNTELLYNGKPLNADIRSEKTAVFAAVIAQNPTLRFFFKNIQQELGRQNALLAEGRDMGTEIFPNATCKIFLDAKPSVRAMRRFLQLQQQGESCELTLLTKQISERDDLDRNRPIAPLQPAPDASIIDTSELSIEEVFKVIIRCCNEKIIRKSTLSI